MVKVKIYDPQTKKTTLMDPLGRRAREIYRYKIDVQKIAPASVLPPELTLIGNRFKKVKNITNFNNVRRITFGQVDSVSGTDQLSYINNIIRSYQGKTIQVAYKFYVLDSNGVLVERTDTNTYDVPKSGQGYSEFWRNLYQFLRPVYSDTWIFSDEFNNSDQVNQQAQLIIMTADKVGQGDYEQYFLDGITHCVFTPMLNWAQSCLQDANSTSSKKKYNAKINKLNKYIEIYSQGVREKNIQAICDDLDVGIKIDTPSSSTNKTKFIDYEPSKNPNPIKRFSFINTRLNHIELNEITHQSAFVEKSQKFLNDYVNDCIESKKYCLWKGDIDRVYEISTLDCRYKLTQDEGYSKEVREFEGQYSLYEVQLEHFSNKKLSEFLSNNIHCCQSLLFNHPCRSAPGLWAEISELDDEERASEKLEQIKFLKDDRWKDEAVQALKIIDFIDESKNLNHIDMEKAYTRGLHNTHYKGYLGKITDFRMTDKIEGIGIYQIKNIQNLPPLFGRLGVLYSGNAYPSPELEYYQSLGITFDIIGGCWGSRIDIDFGNDFEAGMYKKDNNGLSHYKRWFGCQMKLTTKNRFNFTCENIEFAKLNNLGSDCDIRFNQYKNIGMIEYEKKTAYHSPHIASFCTSYCRMSMIEQLLKFKDINQIVAIQTDGIYYKGEVEIGGLFHKDKIGKGFKNISGDQFVEDLENEYLDLDAKTRKHNRVELHVGVGGAGKTHKNLMDTGFVSPVYIAPSWKLARSKSKEYNIDSLVFQRLIHTNPNIYNPILKKYNTLIIDEVSMLSNKDKEIILRRFWNHKIIFCGDLGYQLPPVQGLEFKIGSIPVIKHNTNYRCKCEQLQKILLLCRKAIKRDPDDLYPNMTKIVKGFGFEIIDKNLIDYKVNDLIITKTRKAAFEGKDSYTEKYKDIEKYIITENTVNHSNGEIVFEKPDCDHKLRHGFTIHSIQGETATDKLFIDINNMTSLRMMYTALSRARFFSQIIIVK